MNGPSGIRGKALALALLIAVFVAGYGLVIEPLMSEYVRLQRSIDQSRHLLAKYRALEATREGLESDLATLRARKTRETEYLTAATASLAGAEIQNRLKDVLEDVGAEPRSVQTLQDGNDESGGRVRVRVQFTVRSESLNQVLYLLETEAPLLFVDNIDIRRKQDRRRQQRDDRVASLMTRDVLDVRMDLHGFMRAPSS